MKAKRNKTKTKPEHVSVTVRLPAEMEKILADRGAARLTSRNHIIRELLLNTLRAEGFSL